MNDMAIGICKLCGHEKMLLRRSHIIPEFNYDILYDDKNFIYRLNFSIKKKFNEISKIAKGEYEGNILCSNCDSVIIQSYEDYTARMIYAKKPLPVEERPNCSNHINQEGQEFSFCQNINYAKTKLYFLSILWRASISRRPFFELIKVLDYEKEELRKIVHSGTPGNYRQFPILIYGWLNDPTAKRDIILQPKRYIEQHGFRYCFPIRGIIFNIYTDIRDVPINLQEFLLKDDCLPMLHIQRGDYMNWIKHYNGLSKPN